ncbi:hypothetical protein [Streptomyces sp. SID3343]|uniref:hypothetical protein n=1 Tax=Streptomyces sp. SID3343 TaxID=2690260 RepID=UPI00136D1306|nr:hypothetical protein [Streptomyces sp. SID3343]MYW02516.1 hypothetical protein [Streptomyces sp. SID3343]
MPQHDWQLTEFSYGQGIVVAHYRTPEHAMEFETLRVHPADVPLLIAELFKTMDQNLRVDVLAEVNAANERVVASRRAAIGRSIATRLGLPGASTGAGGAPVDHRARTTAKPHHDAGRSEACGDEGTASTSPDSITGA